MVEKVEGRRKPQKMVVSMIVVIGIIIIGLFVALNTFITNRVRAMTVKVEMENIGTLFDSYLETTNAFVERTLSELDFYSNADVVYEGGSPAEIGAWLATTPDRRSESFSYVLFIGTDGNSFYDSGKTGFHGDRAYYKRIVNGEPFVVNNPTIAKATGIVSVMFVKAAKDKTGKLVGMFVGVAGMDYLQNLILGLKVGENGHGFMLDGDGEVIAHYDSALVMNANFLQDNNVSAEMKALAKKMTGGKSGTEELVDAATGDSIHYTYKSVSKTPWSMGLSVPISQINETANALQSILRAGNIIIAIIILVVMTLIISTSIRPLKVVEERINEIADNADLTKRLDHVSNNEIGEVAYGFNNLLAKFQNILQKINMSKMDLGIVGEDLQASIAETEAKISDVVQNIELVKKRIATQNGSVDSTSASATEITSKIQQLESMIEDQNAKVSDASAAVEEMVANISSVNNFVSMLADAFNKLRDNADEGIKKQNSMNELVKQIKKQPETLQTANMAIATISEQTNLLAMNAAIESAHAGESGKGFAVVAGEIRKLSETSAHQSKTISEQLSTIMESIGNVSASSLAASSAFQTVSQKINDTNEIVRSISTAMTEQQHGSKQILNALGAVDDSTIQVKSASRAMTDESKSILNEISVLKRNSESINASLGEMDEGLMKINQTRDTLSGISKKMDSTIQQIGSDIGIFNV